MKYLVQFGLAKSATDQDGQSDTAIVTITLRDLNDNKPIVRYPLPNRDVVWVNPNLRTGQAVASITAKDADQGLNGKLQMTLENDDVDFVNVNPKGEIILQRDLTPSDHGRHSISVRIKDLGKPSSFVILRVSSSIFLNSNKNIH